MGTKSGPKIIPVGPKTGDPGGCSESEKTLENVTFEPPGALSKPRGPASFFWPLDPMDSGGSSGAVLDAFGVSVRRPLGDFLKVFVAPPAASLGSSCLSCMGSGCFLECLWLLCLSHTIFRRLGSGLPGDSQSSGIAWDPKPLAGISCESPVKRPHGFWRVLGGWCGRFCGFFCCSLRVLGGS